MKSVTLNMLRRYDFAHRTSLVRDIEMALEGCLINTPYAIQFWGDAELYGIEQAFLYAQRARKHVSSTGLAELEASIKTAVKMVRETLKPLSERAKNGLA